MPRTTVSDAITTTPDKCLNCQTTNPDDDIQEGLCAKCFSALPEGEWTVAGTW